MDAIEDPLNRLLDIDLRPIKGIPDLVNIDAAIDALAQHVFATQHGSHQK